VTVKKNLRSLQRDFAAAVMRPLTPGERMQSKGIDGKSLRRAAATFIKPNDRLTSFERIEIYNRQYWFRLLGCLYDDFPGLRALLGEKQFHAMAVAYLTKYPSRSHTLRDLGDRLEKFLAREPRWTARHPRLARDLVRLEWAHIVAFDEECLSPLEIDDLLGSDPATLRLTPQPCITFLACDYPVDDFLLGVRRRVEPAGEASNAMNERPKWKTSSKSKPPAPKKIWLAIHRHKNAVYYKRLEPEAFLICAALKKGLTLQNACERALRRRKADENFAAKLQTWFAQWASLGWFSRAV
jgi:hypothetical protein